MAQKSQSRIINRSRLYAAMFALILPTLIGLIVFNYYPKLQAVKYSFYRWDGSTIEEFRGLKNFVDAFNSDPLFWPTFKLIGILLVANIVKMSPSILTAVVVHRLRSQRWQYIYRAMLVIPMVIPSLVWMLMWKSFYDPTVGILNSILRATRLMNVLRWLDTAMPALAQPLGLFRNIVIDPIFGSVWGLGLFALVMLAVMKGLRGILKLWLLWLVLLPTSYLIWGPIRMLLFLVPVVTAGQLLCDSMSGRRLIKWFAGISFVIAAIVIAGSMIWTEPTRAFENGTPAWLGHSKLVIPALIFWGFPWVGTVGGSIAVLLFIAGLKNISQDVYEAGELDGVGPIGKLFKIELPLIMTQIRINLILITIWTFTDYSLFLILLGPHGGPGNKGMVPGLYMYREAFFNGRFGYACALGMVLFVVILSLTIIYQKYVKVEK